MQERALEEDKIFVSAFDDPYIIAGQARAFLYLTGIPYS